MIPPPPSSTHKDTLLPNPTLFRSPGGRGIARQRHDIRQVDPRIDLGIVGDQVPVQDVGEQDHAIEVDVLPLQPERPPGGAPRPLAFAIEIFGRGPQAVFRQEYASEYGRAENIRVDAIPSRRLVPPRAHTT